MATNPLLALVWPRSSLYHIVSDPCTSVNPAGWVSFRLDLFGSALTLAATLSCVWFRTTLSPSVVGLMLLQLRQAIQYYRWAAKISVDMESKMVYVERVLHYIDLTTEPALRLPGRDPQLPFPRAGRVEFIHACLV